MRVEKIIQVLETREEVAKEESPTVAQVAGREKRIRTKEKSIKIVRRKLWRLQG